MRKRGRPLKYTDTPEVIEPKPNKRVQTEEQKESRKEYMREYMREYRAFNHARIIEIEQAYLRRKQQFKTGGLENGGNKTETEVDTESRGHPES